MTEIDYGSTGQYPTDAPYCEAKDERLEDVHFKLGEAILYAGLNGMLPYADLEGQIQIDEDALWHPTIVVLTEYLFPELDERGEMKTTDGWHAVYSIRRELIVRGSLAHDRTALFSRILAYRTENLPVMKEEIHADSSWTMHDRMRMAVKGVLAIQGSFEHKAARIYTPYNVDPAAAVEDIKGVIVQGRQ